MAVQLINLGNIANDGTGDDLREAFLKVNSNFEELDLRVPEATTASNRGMLGEGLFFTKVGYDLQFKKIAAGSNVTLTATDNAITVNALGGLQNLLISADGGSIQLADGDALTIAGGTDIETSISGNTLTVNYTGFPALVNDTGPQLSATLQADENDINNVGVFRGRDYEGDVWGIDTRPYLNDADFGSINTVANNIIDLLILSQDIDFGSITAPASIEYDLGSF